MTIQRLFSALILFLLAAGAGAAGPVISEIRIQRGNIFDPANSKESAWPYRTTNALHFITRESFILRELLFKAGDPCDPGMLMESERRLRATGLLNPVSITSTPLPDGTCRVDVNTRDVWTTKPGITYSSYGGKSKWSADLEESNFMGYGKNLLFSYKKDVDTRKYILDYKDPQFLHRTWDLDAGIWDTDDGNGFIFSVDQPFDSFTIPEAYQFSIRKDRQRLYDYWDGEKAFSYISDSRAFTMNYGRRLKPDGDSLWRLTWGVQRLEQIFRDTSTLVPGHPFGPADPYTLNLLTLSVEHFHYKYLKTHGIVGFTSDEDILLGPDIVMNIGYSPTLLGGDQGWNFSGIYQDSVQWPGRLWQRRVQLSLLQVESSWRDNLLKVDSNYFIRTSDRSDLTVAASVDGYHSPDLKAVLYLGAEEGQRGYGYEVVSGSRRWRATVQERILLWENVLALANVGVALFYDAGQVWGWGRSISGTGVYQDAGVGIRLENLRSKVARVARIDLGYAFRADHRGWQVTLSTGDWFNF